MDCDLPDYTEEIYLIDLCAEPGCNHLNMGHKYCRCHRERNKGMIAKVGEDIYKVTFAHIKPRPRQGQYKMVTMCNIWKYDPIIWGESIEGTDSKDWLNLCYGIAKCGKNDNFCKETGRKIALTRALRFFKDKEIRSAIWDAYFKRDNRKV